MTERTKNDGWREFAQTFAADLLKGLTPASTAGWSVHEAVEVDTLPSDQGFAATFRFSGCLKGDCCVLIPMESAETLKSLCEGEGDKQGLLFRAMTDAALRFSKARLDEYGDFTVKSFLSEGEPFGSSRATRITVKIDGTPVVVYVTVARILENSLSGASNAGSTFHGRSLDPALFVPGAQNLDVVMDVELDVALRFGQRQLTLREVLELTSGSVVELDREVDDPIELILDGNVIARGEAVVIDGNYGLRVTELASCFANKIKR